MWDVRTGTSISVVNDHHADVYGIASHPSRPFFFGSTSRDTTIRFWTLEPTFKDLYIRAVAKRSLSELIGNPEPLFEKLTSSSRILTGVGSKTINAQIQNV